MPSMVHVFFYKDACMCLKIYCCGTVYLPRSSTTARDRTVPRFYVECLAS